MTSIPLAGPAVPSSPPTWCISSLWDLRPTGGPGWLQDLQLSDALPGWNLQRQQGLNTKTLQKRLKMLKKKKKIQELHVWKCGGTSVSLHPQLLGCVHTKSQRYNKMAVFPSPFLVGPPVVELMHWVMIFTADLSGAGTWYRLNFLGQRSPRHAAAANHRDPRPTRQQTTQLDVAQWVLLHSSYETLPSSVAAMYLVWTQPHWQQTWRSYFSPCVFSAVTLEKRETWATATNGKPKTCRNTPMMNSVSCHGKSPEEQNKAPQNIKAWTNKLES